MIHAVQEKMRIKHNSASYFLAPILTIFNVYREKGLVAIIYVKLYLFSHLPTANRLFL
jgi:hypothetical protein